MDDDVYADFIAEVLAGGFAAPPAGQWRAEQIAAHVARRHEELIRAAEAVMSGEPAAYSDAEANDAAVLDRYVEAYHGLRGLADRIAETVVTLRELAARLDERDPTERGEGHEGRSWAEILRTDETAHVRHHLDQLRALRPASTTG